MKKLGLALLLAILFLTLATPVLADGPDDDVVIWGSDFTLESGQRIKGELLVYGGNVTLKEDSKVDGDATVFGGNLTIKGTVEGDVTVWGGNVNIEAEATIRGRVVAVGGNVNRDEGADVRGGEIEGFPFPPTRMPRVPRPPIPPRPPVIRTHTSWGSNLMTQIGNLFRSLFSIMVITVLSILVVVFIPRHTDTVVETMLKAPVQSILTGLVAFIVVPVVTLVLAITVCLLPISAVALLITGIALLFGWIAAALMVGGKVLRGLSSKEPNRVAAVAIGMPILVLIWIIPCIGWFLGLAILVWSLGAVAYSYFGTRAYGQPAPHLGSKPEGYDPRMDKL